LVDADYHEDLIKSLQTYFPDLTEAKIREGLAKTKLKYYPLITKIDDYDLVSRLQKLLLRALVLPKTAGVIILMAL